jgi:acetoin utilization protein AcuB
MLVGQRMSRPVISIAPDLPITEALSMLKRDNIRRAPVVKRGKLVGIVTIADIMNASPSQATSLSIWEVNYLVSKITVNDVMTKDVVTVPENMPIEDAARLMADTKIGGLPVMRGKEIVGMITETDLFKIFLEMMGARQVGLRASFLVPNQAGELAKVSKLVYKSGGNILSLGTFSGESPSNVLVTLKVEGIEPDALRKLLEPIALEIQDIRIC